MLTFKIPFAVMLLLEQADLSPDKGLKHSYSHVCQQQFSSRTGKVTRHATELFLKIGVSEKLNFYKLEYLPFKNKKNGSLLEEKSSQNIRLPVPGFFSLIKKVFPMSRC